MRLTAEQFKNIRNGDKFWYENTFPINIVREIRQTTLAHIISRNSDAIVNEDVFRAF